VAAGLRMGLPGAAHPRSGGVGAGYWWALAGAGGTGTRPPNQAPSQIKLPLILTKQSGHYGAHRPNSVHEKTDTTCKANYKIFARAFFNELALGCFCITK